jgi:hypothetical protein
VGLNAKSELAGALSDNKVIDYNANAMSSRLARSFIKKTGFEIAVHRKGKLRHDQVLTFLPVPKSMKALLSPMALVPHSQRRWPWALFQCRCQLLAATNGLPICCQSQRSYSCGCQGGNLERPRPIK